MNFSKRLDPSDLMEMDIARSGLKKPEKEGYTLTINSMRMSRT